jgi:LysM repeat protein
MDQIYDLNSFLVSWAVLGNRGVVLEGEPVARPSVPATNGRKYVVRPGDTLSEIAAQYNIGWQTLADLNQMAYPYLVYVDQEILLPDNAQPEEPVQTPEPTPTANPTPVANYGTYTIQVGDTLIGLADQFNLPWQALAQANEMSYPYFIYPGQQLNLPESSVR